MARRRSRRSPVDAFLHRLAAWLVALVVLLLAVSYLFESAPGLALFLFVGLPVVVGIGVLVSKYRAREAAARAREAAEREAEEQARRRVETARHVAALLTGSGADFELAVADVLRAYGYDLHRVGGSGDRVVDLAGTNADGARVVVQCKRYGPDNKVGSPAVQSFIGTVVNQDAAVGIFVTTSTYTRQARELEASSRVPVTLIDGAGLSRVAAVAAGDEPPRPAQQNPSPPAPAVPQPRTYPDWPVQPAHETQPPQHS